MFKSQVECLIPILASAMLSVWNMFEQLKPPNHNHRRFSQQQQMYRIPWNSFHITYYLPLHILLFIWMLLLLLLHRILALWARAPFNRFFVFTFSILFISIQFFLFQTGYVYISHNIILQSSYFIFFLLFTWHKISICDYYLLIVSRWKRLNAQQR